MPLKPNPAPSLELQELNSGGTSLPNREVRSLPDQEELPATAAVIEEAEILHASIRAGSIAQIVVAGIAVIGLLGHSLLLLPRSHQRIRLVGATKIICDYVDSLRGLGARLGE